MWFLNMSEHVQTCLNLVRFNMIQIATIHAILKHVWTCWNTSKLVQIQYDMNCYLSYDSQTCLNMFKHVKTCSDSIWYQLLQFMWFSNMSEPVETCLNLFKFIMIWIDAIFKHVWTCSNLSKLVQIQYDMNWCDS